MRTTYSSFILWILVGILASVHREACSQFGEDARPSKKIESQLLYESEGYPVSYRNSLRAGASSRNCTVAFSSDGTFVLLHDFAAHKLFRIDTQTLQRTLVSESLRLRHVRMHHLTGEIFVWTYGETVTDKQLAEIFADDSSKNIAHSKANDVMSIEENKCILTNYRNVDDFKANKPAWSILDEFISNKASFGSHVWGGYSFNHGGHNLCWLPNVELYAVVQGLGYERRNEEEVLFIDRKGRIAGRFQFGRIMGIDMGESGIEIYHLTGKRKPYFAQRSTIDKDLQRIEKTEKLYRLASEWNAGHPFLTYGSKLLRYSDPKPGDVRKFFAEVMNDPRFWSYQDYPNLARDLPMKLPDITTKEFARFTSIPYRMSWSFGILASREDPSIPEVSYLYSDGSNNRQRFYHLHIVMDHMGNLLPLPDRMYAVDAFCKQDQLMLIGERAKGPSGQEFQLIKVVAADPENPNAARQKR